MRKGICIFLLFVLGSTVYSLLEILWRGHTHWTMALTGGGCLLLLYGMDTRMDAKVPFLVRCALGAVLITAVEFAVGFVVNRLLGMAVWDYSDRWGNLMGQVCPAFTALWFFLCIPALWITRGVVGITNFRRKELPHRTAE